MVFRPVVPGARHHRVQYLHLQRLHQIHVQNLSHLKMAMARTHAAAALLQVTARKFQNTHVAFWACTYL